MNESISARAILILLASLVLSACAGMSEGPVPISQSTSAELEGLRTAIRDECLDVSNATAREGTEARRDELVTAFMAAADMSYNVYERELLAFTRDNDLGGALANQLLSAIGAASGSRAISRATNITSGAVSGTQSAFAKSLLNQTVSVLQTHMRAQRASQAARIIERLGLPYAQWNTCLALREALAYEQAGTLNAALAAMAASATADEDAGEAEEDRAIRRITYRTDSLADAFAAYLRTGDPQRRTAREAIAELVNLSIIERAGRSDAEILRQFRGGDGTPEQRAALVRRIVQKENGSAAGNALNAALPPQ